VKDDDYQPYSFKKDNTEEMTNGNVIFDIKLLLNSLINTNICYKCKSPLSLFVDKSKQLGLYSVYMWKCKKCSSISSEFESSTKINNIEEINLRLTLGLRCIGVNYGSAGQLLAMLNLDKPASNSKKYVDCLLPVYESLKEQSTEKAITELVHLHMSRCIVAAFDCSWHKTGFHSTTGVLTVCSPETGKVLCSIPMSKYCKQLNENCNCNIKQNGKKSVLIIFNFVNKN
jgi:hypothetical protein